MIIVTSEGKVTIPLTLAMSLGSMIVHAHECLDNHATCDKAGLVDKDTSKSMLTLPEVAEYMHALDSLSLIPVRRDGVKY